MKLLTPVVCASALALASTLLLSPAHATTITTGDAMVTPAAGTYSGTVVATYTGTAVGSFGGSVKYSDPYNVSVIKDTSDTLGGCSGNCLTFAFTFSNPSNDGIQSVTLGNTATNGFANYLSSIFYVNGSGQAPGIAQEDSTGTIHVNYSPTIKNGTSSDTVFIETNATNYTTGFFTTQDDVAATDYGFVPTSVTSVTPEPSSLMLLGTGLVGLAGVARRKFRR